MNKDNPTEKKSFKINYILGINPFPFEIVSNKAREEL